MIAPSMPAPTPAVRADAAIRDVLKAQWDDEPAVRLDSPPGAGKTGVVERLAVQSLALIGERCAVVTQTNVQAFDLARRLGEHYPRLQFWLVLRDGLRVPADVAALGNLHVAHRLADLPSGPCVAIGNAAKWSWADETAAGSFALLIVDEAFQLPDYGFLQIANLARRVVLVGDPGQIDPIVRGEVERWRVTRPVRTSPVPRRSSRATRRSGGCRCRSRGASLLTRSRSSNRPSTPACRSRR